MGARHARATQDHTAQLEKVRAEQVKVLETQVGAGQMMLNTAVVRSALLAALNFWSVTLSFGHVIDPSLVLAVVNGEGVEFPEVTPAAQVE